MRTTKLSKKNSSIRVVPEKCIFRDVVLGAPPYKKRFTITNLSSNAIIVRVSNPKTSNFILSKYFPKKLLAPGLKMSFNVEFFPKKEKDYHDRINIMTSEETRVVPLHAYIPRCDIIPPTSVDLGVCCPSDSISKSFELVNRGSLGGSFKFSFGKGVPLSVTPAEGTISPKSSQVFTIVCNLDEKTGMKHYTSSLVINGKKSKLEVLANVVRRKVFFYQKRKGDISTIKMGTVFFRENSSTTCTLSNANAFATEFEFKKTGGGSSGKSSPFSVFPVSGTLSPYEEIEVGFKFEPKPFGDPQSENGRSVVFEEDWVCNLSNERKVSFGIMGVAEKLKVNLSLKKIQFPLCPVNDYRDVIIELSNASEQPVSFSFSRVAHFFVTPRKGKLLPLSKTNLKVTFHPNQLMGKKTSKFVCSVGGNLKKLNLLVIGQSSGVVKKLDKTSGTLRVKEDFIKPPKYVSNISLLDKGEISLKEYKKRINHYDRYANKASSIIKLNELREKKKNEETYNTFLTTMRNIKVTRKRKKSALKLQQDFLNDINLGLDVCSGLIEPVLPVSF